MLVREVLDMAKYGEVSNIHVKEDDEALLSYVNLGLIELYKRFTLSTKEYLLEVAEGQSLYTMPDDYMGLLAAYGEVPEYSSEVVSTLPINVEDNIFSVNTVDWRTVQVPLVLSGRIISLIYTAKPPYLTTNDLNALIPIPTQLLEALLHYVGYRAHMSMNGSIQAENSTHYTRFENSCKKAELNGVVTPDDVNTDSRLALRGFV